MMKLSDYVVDFLVKQGVRHAFVVSGGASIHLLHSAAQHPGMQHICPHHEQAAAMAADAYARVTGNLGCAIATSGPGATNMITGIAGAWFDSVPTIFITGQVTTFRMKGDTGVRQLGFQETEIIPMVAPITKYAVQVRKAEDIRYELEKAIHIAKEGRPGPVVVDIPDDVQRQRVAPSQLKGFTPHAKSEPAVPQASADDLNTLVSLIGRAKRPVLVLGWGIRLSDAVNKAVALVERLGFPVLTSWAAKDMLPYNHHCLAGTFGTHGTRVGNFTIQNADLLIGIGTRMSTRETGSPMDSWAREAKTVIVDIDSSELKKFPAFGKKLDLAICADAGNFIQALLDKISPVNTPDISEWKAQVDDWKKRYPPCPAESKNDRETNPYFFVDRLGAAVPAGEHVFIDTGCSIAWTMQAGSFCAGQRLYHDFNNTAMGWALPAAVGGSLALGNAPVTCVVGDGSMMMNIQELATIKKHNLPVRILVLNNQGYGMVRQTEEQWLNGDHAGTSSSDLGFPDFVDLAKSFSIPAVRVTQNDQIDITLREIYALNSSVLVDVVVPERHGVVPQARYGYPIEDSEPLLPRDEFLKNMLVKPMPKSLEPLD